MTCNEAKEMFAENWAQTLPAAARITLTEHLASCSACRSEAGHLGELWRNLPTTPDEEPSAALRSRFYQTLDAFSDDVFHSRWWPLKPILRIAFAAVLLLAGVGIGYELNTQETSEVTDLRSEMRSMRQLVILSLLQQQSAGERLRGVSWAAEADFGDGEVLSALVSAIDHDSNVNVRLAAVDALRVFASRTATRRAIVDSLPKQSAPLVQIALLDLAVDLKEQSAAAPLQKLALDAATNSDVRERARWALEKLQ